jgi:LPXTG-motif cell wall-anchored protein
MLSSMQPHWLMIAGAILVVLGFAGLVFRRNRNAEANREPTEMTADGKSSPPAGRAGAEGEDQMTVL